MYFKLVNLFNNSLSYISTPAIIIVASNASSNNSCLVILFPLLCILYFIPDDFSKFNGPLSFSEKVDKATKIKLLFIDKFIYIENPIKLGITFNG